MSTVFAGLVAAAVLAGPAPEASAFTENFGKRGAVSVPSGGCELLGGVSTPITYRLSAPIPSAAGANVNPRRSDRTMIRYAVARVQALPSGEMNVIEATSWSAGIWAQEGSWVSWSGEPAVLYGGSGDRWLLGYSFEWWRKKLGRWQRVGWEFTTVENYAMRYGSYSFGDATICTSPWGPAGPVPLPPNLVPGRAH